MYIPQCRHVLYSTCDAVAIDNMTFLWCWISALVDLRVAMHYNLGIDQLP
jgi:hypothetical protein